MWSVLEIIIPQTDEKINYPKGLEFTHFSGSGEARWIAARDGDKKAAPPRRFSVYYRVQKKTKKEGAAP